MRDAGMPGDLVAGGGERLGAAGAIDTPAPASAKASAIARPMPRLPPATTARLPAISIFMLPPQATPAHHALVNMATEGLGR